MRKRIHIQHMFISALSKKTCTYDIGLLDDNFNYSSFSFTLIVDAITPNIAKRLNRLFNKYDFDKATHITFLNYIDVEDTIYMYFNIRNQAAKSTIMSVDLNRIPRRIATYHKSFFGMFKKPSGITKNFIERLWTKLVETEKCPWINAEVNLKLSNMSISTRRREIILRLAMYYMLIKNYLFKQTLKYTKSKTQNSTI